ncbi:MAG TPA: HlyD family secretion protein [Xanthobacteraceae bacterium]|nr:HlyD family secretion protein [Xanthobacteraceae bacterium]
MAEPALKLAPAQTETPAPAPAVRSRSARHKLRFVLLVALPALALAVGFYIYLQGGRYISTDNAYVGAQKVLITPDISGKISAVLVEEGQHVRRGDPLFEIDPEPYRLAVEQARARLASVRSDFATVKANLRATERLISLAEETMRLKQADLDRKSALLANRAGAQVDVDSAAAALVAAKTQRAQLLQQRDAYLTQLLGDPDLPIEKFPPYMQAAAALDQAERDLAHTTVRAPLDGMATQVPSIQIGRYVSAGTPVFAIVDDSRPWVDANPKETDVTYLQVGQTVTISVDAFPDRTFTGMVAAVSPGTGAQFAILPPQNASGNWVKVVQRLPVRIEFVPGQDLARLRAGMSATVEIDTGRTRSLAGLFGFAAKAKDPEK